MLQCGLVRANFSLAMSLALVSRGRQWTDDRGRMRTPSLAARHVSSASVVRSLSSVIRSGAGEGNRTPVVSLEGCCSTIELHPQASGAAGGGGWIRTNV